MRREYVSRLYAESHRLVGRWCTSGLFGICYRRIWTGHETDHLNIPGSRVSSTLPLVVCLMHLAASKVLVRQYYNGVQCDDRIVPEPTG